MLVTYLLQFMFAVIGVQLFKVILFQLYTITNKIKYLVKGNHDRLYVCASIFEEYFFSLLFYVCFGLLMYFEKLWMWLERNAD